MGAPIFSYPENYMKMMQALYDNEAGEALRRFNLFAFIIHDPGTHLDFDQQLNGLFEILDRGTGDKLLFFAFVKPSEKWLRAAEKDSDYYQLLEELNTSTVDPSIIASSLADDFGISYDDLPCLVVTPNFSSKEFIWFRTCPDHIKDQLEKLALSAYRNQTREEIHTALQELENEIDLCGGTGTESLEDESIFEALCDAMYFIIANNNPSPSEKQQAFERIKEKFSNLDRKRLDTKLEILKNNNQIKCLEAELETLKNNNQINIEKFDELCLKRDLSLARSNPQTRNLNLGDFIGIDREFLEDDSYQKLKVAQAVLDLLEQSDQAINFGIDPDNPDNIDYTPGVICLAKAFEREVNLSVVHWIRQLLGIDLPLYFDRHQPCRQAEADEVNFNKEKVGGSWQPPTMGQSMRALKSISDRPDGWEDEKWQTLKDNWQKIRPERNDAAHEPWVDRGSIDVVKEALCNLAEDGIFENLHLMKEEYKGYVTIPDAELRAAFEEKLGVPITAANMESLNRLPNLNNNGISDLTGLESATNLNRLILNDNTISNLSPLSELTNLKALYLNDNKITYLSPLSELTNLKALYLNSNEITYLSPLSELTSLKTLHLNSNEITDLSPLSELTDLGELGLKYNKITDFSSLKHLKAILR